MNPNNSSNSINPITFFAVDLEDYFQVHAFSNVKKIEDLDSCHIRIGDSKNDWEYANRFDPDFELRPDMYPRRTALHG